MGRQAMGHHTTQGVTTYDDDFYAWTQRQAKLLRALQSRRPDLPEELDIDHLAEEVEALGRAELRSVASLIRQIMFHLIKAASEPEARARAHWLAKAVTFQADRPGYYAPSMRPLIDMDAIWRKARKLADAQLTEHGTSLPPGLSGSSPFSIDDMLVDDFDFDAALARLRSFAPSA